MRSTAYVPFQLGALGAAVDPGALARTAVSTGGGYAAGAAAGAAYGSVVPGIGTVVGAVVGLAIGSLLKKNYLNVPGVNADEDNSVAAFNQYRRVAGQAPGRQFGLAAMRYVWKGALYAGHFPKNNFKLCYHEGCFKYLGQPSMIDDVLDKTCGDRNCFRDVLPQWLASRSSAAPTVTARSAVVTRLPTQRGGMLRGYLAVTRPTSMTPTLPAEMLRYARRSFKGFGALGRLGTLGQTGTVGPAVPDAVSFIDQFFIPAQARCSASSGCGWAVPIDSAGHQLLYDVADAWLSENAGVTTTPFVATQTQIAPPVAGQPAVPTAPMVAAGSTAGGGVVAVQPLVSPQAGRACTPYPLGVPQPMISCASGVLCQEGGCGNPTTVAPVLNPVSTPLFTGSAYSTAGGAQAVTSVTAATSANLDAQLASQGFTRVGTTSSGFPIYADASGNAYVYQNGGMFPYGTAAQVGVTGNVGSGVLPPDPTQGGTAALPALTPAATAPGISSDVILWGGGALLLIMLLRK